MRGYDIRVLKYDTIFKIPSYFFNIKKCKMYISVA